MKYELAKQLKEAGFPEITRRACELNLRRYIHMESEESVSEPYLQELLAECGWRFFELRVMRNTNTGEYWWLAHSWDPEMMPLEGEGSTPEEAVAKLWLALHQS